MTFCQDYVKKSKKVAFWPKLVLICDKSRQFAGLLHEPSEISRIDIRGKWSLPHRHYNRYVMQRSTRLAHGR